MSVKYSRFSPYANTGQSAGHLDFWSPRDIIAETDDILFEVSERYYHRPDLLSYDLYDTVDLCNTQSWDYTRLYF